MSNNINIGENGRVVLEKRYLKKDENGNTVESIFDLFTRVSETIGDVDKKFGVNDTSQIKKEFFEIMTNTDFLPNSPTLMNAGRDLGQLAACFVLPIEDSMEGIFSAIKNAALIHKSGGGTGFSFSRLRPSGSSVRSTGGVASGPISFMKVFNAATEAVKQGGTRRGANMGILRVDHPDILNFIKAKENNDEITNFNISIGITEDFMKAVEKKENYNLINPFNKKVEGILSASEVFENIVNMAWKNGEPGIIFLDRINKDNPTPEIGEVESTNPCGEQPLLPYESCNLGSINLSNMVKIEGEKTVVDFDRLRFVTHKAIHFLDNVIEANKYPLKEIEEMTKANRKIGLGVMGFADLLIKLRIPYNSDEGVKLAETVMEFIDKESKKASLELGEKRGPFTNYDKSIFKKDNLKYRNATTTTIAPTGSISIIASASGGVEPLFAISYYRNVMDGEHLVEAHPLFEQVARENGFYSKELMDKVATQGHLNGIEEVPNWVKEVFVTSHDISPDWHIKMQSAFQKHVDNAVSKTINFKNKSTKSEVKDAFFAAYKLGCKGLTIYRDGSRDGQVLNLGKSEENKEKEDIKESKVKPRQRPKITTGITEKVKIGCGNLYVTVNYDEEGICEVFTNLGRAGGCPSQSEATSRLASIGLRSGVEAEEIIQQLKGIRCQATLRKRTKDKDINVLSCPDAIGKALERVLDKTEFDKNKDLQNFNNKKAKVENKIIKEEKSINKCPECSTEIIAESGCIICRNCGFSACG